MPIYEYRCGQCGHEKEALQKLSDPPTLPCPECSATMTRRVSAAGFQLKGSGWYVTDFRNNGAKPAAGKDGAKADDAKPADGTSGTETPPSDAGAKAAAPAADKPATEKSAAAPTAKPD